VGGAVQRVGDGGLGGMSADGAVLGVAAGSAISLSFRISSQYVSGDSSSKVGKVIDVEAFAVFIPLLKNGLL